MTIILLCWMKIEIVMGTRMLYGLVMGLDSLRRWLSGGFPLDRMLCRPVTGLDSLRRWLSGGFPLDLCVLDFLWCWR